MTLSNTDRQRELNETLDALLEGLAGRALNDYVFGTNDPQTQTVRRTTWDEFVRRRWVKRLGDSPLYMLTGSGWIAALRLTNAIKEDQLRQDALNLIQLLKRKVKGREGDGVATIHDFTSDGVSAAFVFNAIESGLLEELFPGRGYRTYWAASDPWNDGAPHFIIPRDFALQELE